MGFELQELSRRMRIRGDSRRYRSYFLPKKPAVPANFTHKCENCGHEATYQRNDLSYRDETMPSRMETKKCAESGEPSAVPQALEGNSH
jgi:hypothetical protein